MYCKHDVVKLLFFICFTVEAKDEDDEGREDKEEEKEDSDDVIDDDLEGNDVEAEDEEENGIASGIRKLNNVLLC